MIAHGTHLHIGSLLFEGVDQIDLTGPFEVLSRIPNSTYRIYGKTAAPVRDLKGLRLTPDATLADAPPLDVLHVPGGYGQEALMEDSEILGIRRLRLTRDCLARSRKISSGHLFYKISHAAIFGFLSNRVRKTLDAKKIRHAQITFGLLQNACVDEDYILKLLPELPPGDSELYSHPSLDEFKHEFDALISPRVKEKIKSLGIELIPYQDL